MRRLCLFAALAAGVAVAQPPKPESPKADPFRLPDLAAKEWKEQGKDGLKVWDVREGKGEAARPGGTVTVHYTGWLTDGKVFDSSVKRKESITFPLEKVIKGWQEGMPGMKPGGVRRLYIPWALAYGENGKPPVIPAKADLVFEVELLDDPFALPDLQSKEWKPLGEAGLKTWDVRPGTGAEVKPGDTVTIHYTGWTLQGKIFDSSRKGRGEPATFPLGNLIQGWQVGIPGVKEGGTRRLLIPWQMAYGEKGSPPDIPGRADLVFDIEVIKTGK
jgi:peptidylprolyl isomerase